MNLAREIRNQTQPRRGLRRGEAAVYIGISPTKFDELVENGHLPQPKRIDRIVVWDVRSLDEAFDALPGDNSDVSNPWD